MVGTEEIANRKPHAPEGKGSAVSMPRGRGLWNGVRGQGFDKVVMSLALVLLPKLLHFLAAGAWHSCWHPLTPHICEGVRAEGQFGDSSMAMGCSWDYSLPPTSLSFSRYGAEVREIITPVGLGPTNKPHTWV